MEMQQPLRGSCEKIEISIFNRDYSVTILLIPLQFLEEEERREREKERKRGRRRGGGGGGGGGY